MGMAGFRMVEGAFNAARDGDIAGAFKVVKGEGGAAALLGVPIAPGSVKQLQRVQQVLGVFLGDVLHPKSLRTRVKVRGRVLRFQRPGVMGTSAQPQGAKNLMRRSSAR